LDGLGDVTYNLTFHSKGCEIRKVVSERLVENKTKPQEMYTYSMNPKENFFIWE